MMPFKNRSHPSIHPSSPRLEWTLGTNDKGWFTLSSLLKIKWFILSLLLKITWIFWVHRKKNIVRKIILNIVIKSKNHLKKSYFSFTLSVLRSKMYRMGKPLSSSTPGFSFIEVMIAITLLAIFGSSLFLVQTSLLSKLTQTHTAVINALERDKQMAQWNLKVQQTFLDKKTAETIKFQEEHKNPDYTVEIKCNPIHKDSVLASDFSEKLFIVQAIIKDGKKQDSSWTFLYFPPHEAEKNEQKQPKEIPKGQP